MSTPAITESLSSISQMKNHAKVMLNEIKSIADDSQKDNIVTNTNSATNFNDLLKQAINQVNTIQDNADNLQKSYELGINNVSISDVMIATEQSKIAFNALLMVRNKAIEAYKDIMNMPL